MQSWGLDFSASLIIGGMFFFQKKIVGEWWELEVPPHDIESPAQIVKILNRFKVFFSLYMETNLRLSNPTICPRLRSLQNK